MLGAQAKNNEGVQISDVAKFQFLLNFWSYAEISELYSIQRITTVEYKAFPNIEYADDFFFGFCVTDRAAIAKNPDLFPKRDSVFRNNMAVGLSSNIDLHLQLAPRNTEKSPWNNIKETTLLYRQVSYTAYQYPFALALADCISQPEWTTTLIKSIGQLSKVGGGDSVSHFNMAPRSIIVRLTRSLVEGYDSYGFNEDGEFNELNRLMNDDCKICTIIPSAILVKNAKPKHTEVNTRPSLLTARLSLI